MKVPTPPPRYVQEPSPDELAFRFRTGDVARSLSDLADALARVPADAVWFHREHLVPWARDVLQDDPLARRVEGLAEEASDAEMLRELLLDLATRRLEQLSK